MDPVDSKKAARQAEVVRAATDVFLRYGFARTTMGDVATATGISRPALYLIFPGKEELFAAVARQMDVESHAQMRAGLPAYSTLAAKLHFVCEIWGSHGFDIMSAHPDARDLFDLNYPPVQEIYDHFQELVVELIAEAVVRSGVRASATELARTLVYAMRGFREIATSSVDMRRLISLQVSQLVALIEGSRG